MVFDNKKIFVDYWFNPRNGKNSVDPDRPWGVGHAGWGAKKVTKGVEITTTQTQSPGWQTAPPGWKKNDTGGIFEMDFRAKEIAIRFFDIGIFTRDIVNGPYFSDKYGKLPPITGFELKTNMHGLTRSDIKFDANSMLVDWNGGSFTEDTYVNIYVKFGQTLAGTKKADILKGNKGSDYIIGGRGVDKMAGRGETDVFVFRKGDTGKTTKKADLITDFNRKQADKIDLHLWDADAKKAGMQDFDFIGRKEFTKTAGELRYEKYGSGVLLSGDTNGDGKADLMIKLRGVVNLHESDFIL